MKFCLGLKSLLFLGLSGFLLATHAQDNLYCTHFATRTERARLREQLISQTIESCFHRPLTPDEEENWMAAFWAMELLAYRPETGSKAITHFLQTFTHHSLALQRAVLEAVYTLYQKKFIAQMRTIIEKTDSPKIFTMAVLYLLRQNDDKKSRQSYLEWMYQSFPEWSANPILRCLNYDLQHPASERLRQRPPLADLLRHGGEVDKMVIFSLQRVDRDFPGLTIIRKPDRTFLRNADGQLFAIAHLARSLSALPGYLTNGNTPQGIFSLQAIEPATSPFIGPTPALVLSLPFEVPANLFFHQAKAQDTTWTLEKYQALLPSNWRAYEPIHQAFYAGQAGRCEIIAHGTTVDPQYYANEIYYPFTPSLGCLTALEIWSEEDGCQIYSEQLSLLRAINTVGAKNGYLIVVEIDDQKAPVTLAEIIIDVLKAENATINE